MRTREFKEKSNIIITLFLSTKNENNNEKKKNKNKTIIHLFKSKHVFILVSSSTCYFYEQLTRAGTLKHTYPHNCKCF